MRYTSLLEKFGLALLVFAWVVYGANFVGDTLVHAEKGDVEALMIVVADDGDEGETEVAVIDFATAMATADVAVGEKAFKKCKSCHSVEQGGAHKVGPNLWDIVGRAKGGADGFAYSSALTGLGGDWSVDDLNAFLESPKTYAPGNKMTYRGLSDVEQRAGLIAYLATYGN